MVTGYDYAQGSTTNFYIGLRNVNIDSCNVSPSSELHLLNWAVSQATNLMNVNFIMPKNSSHVGLIMDGGSSGGGSGTFFGDLVSNVCGT